MPELLSFSPLSFCLICHAGEAPPPEPFGAVPDEAQLAWHDLEYYGFIHFTINTFTDLEWGGGGESPELFNPSQCDPEQWARVAAKSGMKGLILTAKHHDGFLPLAQRVYGALGQSLALEGRQG